MGKNKKHPERGAPPTPTDDRLAGARIERVVPEGSDGIDPDPDGPLPEISDEDHQFRPFPEAFDSSFPDEELTPPVMDLPTTGQAVDDLLTQVNLCKQKVADLETEWKKLDVELTAAVGARCDAEADLTMIRTRVADLERQLVETEGSRGAAYEDAHLAAQRIVELENRLLTSELAGNDLKYEVSQLKDLTESIGTKKIWCIVPKLRPDQKRATRLYVLAADLIEAIERAARDGALLSTDDVATVSVSVEHVIF